MVETAVGLADLYDVDETAWLEAMVSLLRRNALADLDYVHLAEYLSDMARRDRRETESRLILLLAHVLKWQYQPERRSKSWRLTIVEQRQELADLVEQGVLRNHAEAVLASAYGKSIERVRAETELPMGAFPADCPLSLEQLLAFDPLGSDNNESE